jgi:6-phosphogluconolactonase (cycloisomerase 2 family)
LQDNISSFPARKSDRLAVYRVDQANGNLSEPRVSPAGKGANWIEIVEVREDD